jgi:ATP-dependent Clp protease protease subunit
LTGPVGEEVAKETVCLLLEFQRQDPMREVTIILDSYGGEVDSMYAITDVMELVITPIRTICIGKAMSAAAFIFLSGAKGRRFMTRHSRLMFHQMSSSHWGPVSDILISTNEIRFLQEQMVDDISNRSKLKPDAVRALIDRESYIRPEDAIKMGICDKIIDRLS